MISQRLKDLYFLAMRPAAKLNAWRWRLWYRIRPPDPGMFLNLASGDAYARGFVNIEGNVFKQKELWLDVCNTLPFPDHSVEGIYARHVVEHFYADELRRLLRDCHRILKPAAGIRILVPSLDRAVAAYVAGGASWLPTFPVAYQSLGGKIFNYLMCDSQHRLFFDFAFLEELLHDAGFPRVVLGAPARSRVLDSDRLRCVESPGDGFVEGSLIVEAMTT